MSKFNQQGIAHIAIIIGVVAVSVIGIAGWRVYDANKADKPLLSSSNSSSESQLAQLPLDINGIKTVEEITALAVQQNSGAQIAVIELEQEDSGLVYKVRLQDGRVLVYNAATGQQLSSQTESASSRTAIPAGYVAAISIAKAKEIAQTTYPEKTVKKIEFELEDGVVVYSVRFTDDSRVDINAANGEVVRTKTQDGTTTQQRESGDDSNSQSTQSSDDSSSNSTDDSNDANDDSGSDNSGSNSGSGSGSSGSSSGSDDSADEPDDSDNR